MSANFYVTTPIYYVNDRPHIGHAYTCLASDVLARYHRQAGKRVWFLTGTDEYGQKVERSARRHEETPQAFSDRLAQSFVDLTQAWQLSNDDFIRTTQERHRRAVQALWQRLETAGALYEGRYAGWYSLQEEMFVQSTELQTRNGQQVTASGSPVTWLEEPTVFFRLSQWQEPLLRFYEAHPDFIAPPQRRNEVLAFVRSGLHDLSVSRTTFDWGIPVPEKAGHVVYVWLDALTNYLSALGFPEQTEEMAQFWPADLHIVGKDILRFHAVYWPAFLMAAGLPLPKRIFAHGWWTNEGEKISKSRGNVIDAFELIDRYGLDQSRYSLLRMMAFGKDGDFSHHEISRRINDDLANDLGNLAQRVLTMIARNCSGCLPELGAEQPEDRELEDSLARLPRELAAAMEVQALDKALEAIFRRVTEANGYINRVAPWVLRREDPARMASVLARLAWVLARLALALSPFMPSSMARLLDYLAVPEDQRTGADWQRPLVSGKVLPPPAPLFPRIVPEEPRTEPQETPS